MLSEGSNARPRFRAGKHSNTWKADDAKEDEGYGVNIAGAYQAVIFLSSPLIWLTKMSSFDGSNGVSRKCG